MASGVVPGLSSVPMTSCVIIGPLAMLVAGFGFGFGVRLPGGNMPGSEGHGIARRRRYSASEM